MSKNLSKQELKIFVFIQALCLVAVSLGCLIHAPLWLHIKSEQFWLFITLITGVISSIVVQLIRCRQNRPTITWIQQSILYAFFMVALLFFIYANI